MCCVDIETNSYFPLFPYNFPAQFLAILHCHNLLCSLYLFAERKELSPYTPEGQLRCIQSFAFFMHAPIVEICILLYICIGYSQCCLKDAGFGSQYFAHIFRPEGEVNIGKSAKLLLSMDS